MRGKVRGKHLMRPMLLDRVWRPVDVTDREPVRELEVVGVRGRQVQLFPMSTPALESMQGSWGWGRPRTREQSAEVERHREYARLRNTRRRAWLTQVKQEAGCIQCGLRDAIKLSFHHVDPRTKRFEIGQGITGRKREVLFAEMEKCVLVCFECHRAIHLSEIDATTLPRFDPWAQEPFPS